MEKTHNLEVVGSSPTWSTMKISNLEEIQVADFSFCENNAKTIGLSSAPFSTIFCNFLPYLFSRKLGATLVNNAPLQTTGRVLQRWYDLFPISDHDRNLYLTERIVLSAEWFTP